MDFRWARLLWFRVGGLVVVLVDELRALVNSVRWLCMFLVVWHGVAFSCGVVLY